MSDLTALHEALATLVVTGRDQTEVLSDLTGIARRAMPGSEASSITLIRGDKASTAAFDGQMAIDADELQYQRGNGPCIDAGLAGLTLVVDDMSREQRWPDYAAHAATHGVASSLSIPLPFQGAVIGALNNYSAQRHAFGEDDIALGEAVSGWVALAAGRAEHSARTADEVANLYTAMASRAIIEQAKGILMERRKVSADEAFTVLARASQNANVKLRHVAEGLVNTGALPGSATPA
jgi:GAF domain-containing protein